MWKRSISNSYEVFWKIPYRGDISGWYRHQCPLWYQNLWVANEVFEIERFQLTLGWKRTEIRHQKCNINSDIKWLSTNEDPCTRVHRFRNWKSPWCGETSNRYELPQLKSDKENS